MEYNGRHYLHREIEVINEQKQPETLLLVEEEFFYLHGLPNDDEPEPPEEWTRLENTVFYYLEPKFFTQSDEQIIEYICKNSSLVFSLPHTVE